MTGVIRGFSDDEKSFFIFSILRLSPPNQQPRREHYFPSVDVSLLEQATTPIFQRHGYLYVQLSRAEQIERISVAGELYTPEKSGLKVMVLFLASFTVHENMCFEISGQDHVAAVNNDFFTRFHSMILLSVI